MVSSSVHENDPDMLNIHLGMNEMGVTSEQCCRLQYSTRLQRYLWARAVASQDNSLDRRTYITHILHTAAPDNRIEAAARLSLLPPLDPFPPESGDSDQLEFVGELSDISLKVGSSTFAAIYYTLLFDITHGVGISVVCSTDYYESCYAKLASFLLDLMPDSLAHAMAVNMCAHRFATSAPINIVAEGTDTDSSFVLRYNGEYLDAETIPAGNAIRNATCQYLAALYMTDQEKYREEFKRLVSWLSLTERDKLPPDNYLYCHWAETSNCIRLSQTPEEAIITFLNTAGLGNWNKERLSTDLFFKTLRFMCIRYLEGCERLSDDAPTGTPGHYDGLVRLLANARFPNWVSYTTFYSWLCQYFYEKVDQRKAEELVLAIQTYSPEDGNIVCNELNDKYKIDILGNMVENLQLCNIHPNDPRYPFIWNTRFREKVIELLQKGVTHPDEIGDFREVEKQLRTAAGNAQKNRPAWMKTAQDNLYQSLSSIICQYDVNDVDIPGLLTFRCLLLHDIFGIDEQQIFSTLLNFYNSYRNKQVLSDALNEICRHLHIDHYLYDPYIVLSAQQLAEYVINDCKSTPDSCPTLCDKLCRVNELISVRKNCRLTKDELQDTYDNCFREVWGMHPDAWVVSREYGSLSQLVAGEYPYHPLYQQTALSPFHQSESALWTLCRKLSFHLRDISQYKAAEFSAFLTENALTTALLVKTERAYDLVRNPAGKAFFYVDYGDSLLYDYGFIDYLIQNDSILPHNLPYYLSKDVVAAMRETLPSLRSYLDWWKFSTNDIIRLTAMHMLYGDSDTHLFAFLRRLQELSQYDNDDGGYFSALCAVVLASILSEQCNDREMTESVGNGYKLFKKFFQLRSIPHLWDNDITDSIHALYENRLLLVSIAPLKSSKLPSELKKAINNALVILQEEDYDVTLSKKEQQELEKKRKKQEKQKRAEDKKQEKALAKQQKEQARQQRIKAKRQQEEQARQQQLEVERLQEEQARQQQFEQEKLQLEKQPNPKTKRIMEANMADATVTLTELEKRSKTSSTSEKPADNIDLLQHESKDKFEITSDVNSKEKIHETGENRAVLPGNNNKDNQFNYFEPLEGSSVPSSLNDESAYMYNDSQCEDNSVRNRHNESDCIDSIAGSYRNYENDDKGDSVSTDDTYDTDAIETTNNSDGSYKADDTDGINDTEIKYKSNNLSTDDSELSIPIPSREKPDQAITKKNCVNVQEKTKRTKKIVLSCGRKDALSPFEKAEQERPFVLFLPKRLPIGQLFTALLSVTMGVMLKITPAEKEIKLAVIILFGVLCIGAWPICDILDLKIGNEKIRAINNEIRQCIITFAPILIFTVMLLLGGFILL